MLRKLLLSAVVYIILAVSDELFTEKGDRATIHRSRMFKFALYQDLLVALSVLKMMVFEGYTLSGVLQRVRSAGLMTHVYIATSVALHGALLLDETGDQRVRLNPTPYVPPDLPEDHKDLFLL